ncbi:MAG: thioredoxin family protein [Gemmataceae bacterium]
MGCTNLLLSAAVLLAFTAAVPADGLKIGAPAPSFSNLDTTDGKTISLDDLKGKDVLVIVITCNHCPVAGAHEDRLIAFAKKYCGEGNKIGLVAINVNNSPPDRLDKMKERAKEKGFNFPYAYDPSQKIAEQLGAVCTPEFWVFDKGRKLAYHGAFDDDWKGENVKEQYLIPAVEALLKGDRVKKTTTRAVGCGIEYQKADK